MNFKTKTIAEHRKDVRSIVEHKLAELDRLGQRRTFGLKFEEKVRLNENTLDQILVWKENLND